MSPACLSSHPQERSLTPLHLLACMCCTEPGQCIRFRHCSHRLVQPSRGNAFWDTCSAVQRRISDFCQLCSGKMRAFWKKNAGGCRTIWRVCTGVSGATQCARSRPRTCSDNDAAALSVRIDNDLIVMKQYLFPLFKAWSTNASANIYKTFAPIPKRTSLASQRDFLRRKFLCSRPTTPSMRRGLDQSG